jgi:hypothetical protein
MTEPLIPPVATERRQAGTRRAVLLTLGAVLLVAALATTGVGLFVLYDHTSRRADRASRRVDELKIQVDNLKAEAAAEKVYAGKQFSAGFQAATDVNRSTGLTYPKGFKDGYKAAFAGFDTWTDGAWYLVKIGHAANGHEITNRVDVKPCQRMYLSNDEIYTTGYAC